jgi:hypothetical protein
MPSGFGAALEEAHLPGAGHRLGAATSPQLAVEVVEVGLDGARLDEELLRYIFIRLTGGDECEHLHLKSAG